MKTHDLYGVLKAKLQLYNRKANHNKMYVVTLWKNSRTNRFYVVPYYGRIETFENAGGDFSRLQKGKDSVVSAFTTACHNFDMIVRQKIADRGYTVFMDGVTTSGNQAIPRALALVTQGGAVNEGNGEVRFGDGVTMPRSSVRTPEQVHVQHIPRAVKSLNGKRKRFLEL